MFRKNTPDDFTPYELEHYVNPHFDAVRNYFINYVIPDACAFEIYSAYKNQIEEDSYFIFINDSLTNFNFEFSKEEVNNFKESVSKALKVKYGLIVIKDDPLTLKESFKEE